ncbi:hypothetical protein C8N46_11437 [Kordia periserrulae]|uniref:Uncharacterized protein n=1 Tax=Kordia periserrulae TaxID=701523 RepID=A0A2T6BQS9_9FLAO|nr:hypothetical protein [Kordia periserrulae]PTX58392.1 hypothetical protein C8N46_11437 [Kordia periserrulae]
MKSEKKIKILDSWNISGFGIIAEVENVQDGIPKGTILKSQESELTWIVKSRIVETLAIDELTRFPNETETPIHLNLKNVSSMEKTKERIVEKNLNRIFQYHLEPNKHNEKPKSGEKLLVE